MTSLNSNDKLWTEIEVEELEAREEFGCFIICFSCFCFDCFSF